MAEALSAKPSVLSMSIPLLSSSRSSQRHFLVSYSNSFPLSGHHFRLSQSNRNQPTEPFQSLVFSGFSLKSFQTKLAFSSGAQNGEEGETKSVVGEFEGARGDSTMPSRFRYLTKEAPDRPVRWPWLIAVGFGIYAWRTVLWELSNWKKGVLGIAKFVVYLSKIVLAIVFHFIGTPITNLIRCIETALYTIRSIYSGIVAAAPVEELTTIILLTSALVAIAEAAVPDSANSQPYLLSLAGIIGFAAATDFISELVFWMLLMGIFCFSRFFKKRDLVSSTLPVAAALSAVGQPWLRLVVMTSYIALAISRHSNKLEEDGKSTASKLPAPLLVAGLTIGIHVAAKWVRYRHLTWMIV